MDVDGDGTEHWTAAQARAALADAPVTSFAGMIPSGGVLVVAPHPDDETLGCGGLIACAARSGRPVVVASLTDGEASHPGSRDWPAERLARLRRRELAKALETLTGDALRIERFAARDGGLEVSEPQANRWLTRIAAEGAYGAILTTWGADPHPDHKAAFRIAAHAASAHGVALFAYPIWGLILDDAEDAGPVGRCLRLDVSAMLPRKRAALGAFRSQTGELIRDDPDGFRLQSHDLQRHLGSYEPFIRFTPCTGPCDAARSS